MGETENNEQPKSRAEKPGGAKPAAAGAGAGPGPIEGLVVSSSPHFLTEENIPKIMHSVIFALLPTVVVSAYFYGSRAILLVLVSVVSCVATEYVFEKLRGKPVTITDGSAIITGMLLALTLPPGFPLAGAALGSVFAIAVGKHFFGGLGHNIFNPALLGRAFLQATYPVLITTWTLPFSGGGGVDVVSAATPLALMKFEGVQVNHLDLFFGNFAGSIGETSALAILAGGLYLRFKGYINWKLPLGYLASIAVFSTVFWLYDPVRFADPLFQVLAGGVMLGAWFMVTDYVTTPVTPSGQWIFVISAGFIAVIIRLFGGLPEGVMYSILLMNATVPLLNRWTRPRVFGEGVEEGEERGGGGL
jgi:electron transport complex protein RnfD